MGQSVRLSNIACMILLYFWYVVDKLFLSIGCCLYICINSSYRAYRTPICKAKRGGFKDTHPDDLLAAVLKVGMPFCFNFYIQTLCFDEQFTESIRTSSHYEMLIHKYLRVFLMILPRILPLSACFGNMNVV